MKARMEAAALKGAVAGAVRVANRLAPGISDQVMVEARGDELVLAATNFDMWDYRTFAAEVSRAGAFCAPARALLAATAGLPAGAQVDLAHDEDDDVLTLACGRRRLRLPTRDAEAWPKVEDGVEGAANVVLEAQRLAAHCAFVEPAMSKEEARAYLKSARVEVVDGDLVMVATDSHVLRRVRIATDCDEDLSGTLPSTLVSALAKQRGGEVELALSPTMARIAAPGVTLYGRLIDAAYPDYQRIILSPEAQNQRIEAPREALADAVERASRLCEIQTADRRRPPLILTWSAERQTLIAANEPNAGGSEAGLSRIVEVVEGASSNAEADFMIGVNDAYLRSALASCSADRVAISFAQDKAAEARGGKAPAQTSLATAFYVSDISEDAADRLRMIMPLRTAPFDWSDPFVLEALAA